MITIVLDGDHPDLCPVRAANKKFLRAKGLGQTEDEPMAVFVNKSGKKKYFTGNKISDVLCSARAVHPDMSEDKTKQFSLHSGRVWALVLMSKACMVPDFIKSCLHWYWANHIAYTYMTYPFSNNNTSIPLAKNLRKY